MKKIVILVIVILLISCRRENSISVKQSDAKYPVIVHLDKEGGIRVINFPFKLVVSCNSIIKRGFTDIEYHYGDVKGGWSKLYVEKNGSLTRIDKTKLKFISFYKNQEYFVYSRHLLDTNQFESLNFKKYRKQMNLLSQDTLAIDSFMYHNKTLTKKLLKDNFMILDFYKSKFNDPFKIKISCNF
ncbi:MAG: hypothetical protein COC06_10725 [Bacteroidales bacterium]|nr:MAG: hypothetical protein COC06_10725 [Bacteroidales bacterium]